MREKRHTPRCIGIGMAILAGSLIGTVGRATAAPGVQQPAPVTSGGPHDPGSVLVRFVPGASRANREVARARVGGELIRAFSLVPDLEHIRVPGGNVEKAIEILSRLPHVQYAEPDFVVYEAAAPNDPRFGELWGLHNGGQSGGTVDSDVDAPEAWSFFWGDPNFIVAVIDSGVDLTHPDLAPNLWRNPLEIPDNGLDDDGNGYVDDLHGWDWYNDDNDPYDDRSHGSHVAGTVAAVANNGIGVAGVAPQTKIMALKFLSASGSGYTSDAVRALQYATENGVKVSNNSWGGGSYSQALHDAIQASQSIGHLFVAAAGNSHKNTDPTPYYPQSYALDNIISVAATDRYDALASFSNYGATSVDLGAPGVSILSTVPGGNYELKSGTSMAAPHVAGAAALLYGLNPSQSYHDVRSRILDTVRPVGSLAGKTVSGGVLNLASALIPEAGNPTTSHVDAIVVSTVKSGKLYRGKGTVRLVDNFATPIPGAKVTGTFSGSFNESVTATTDTNGNASLLTAGKSRTTSFKLCVSSISDTTLLYESFDNMVTCASR